MYIIFDILYACVCLFVHCCGSIFNQNVIITKTNKICYTHTYIYFISRMVKYDGIVVWYNYSDEYKSQNINSYRETCSKY